MEGSVHGNEQVRTSKVLRVLTERWFRSGDANLFVRHRPGEPTLLLLHGLAGHSGEWTDVVAALPSSLGVVAPDLRSHGRTTTDGSMKNPTDELLADCVALIQEFSPDGVVVVGQSMGGIVATLLADRHPDLIDGVVLLEAGAAPLDASTLEELIVWHGGWPDDLPGPTPILPALSAQDLRALMSELAGTSRWSEWSALEPPALILSAANGSISGSELEQMCSLRADARWECIPDAGHDAHLDNAQAVAAQLVRFVRDRDGRRGYGSSHEFHTLADRDGHGR